MRTIRSRVRTFSAASESRMVPYAATAASSSSSAGCVGRSADAEVGDSSTSGTAGAGSAASNSTPSRSAIAVHSASVNSSAAPRWVASATRRSAVAVSWARSGCPSPGADRLRPSSRRSVSTSSTWSRRPARTSAVTSSPTACSGSTPCGSSASAGLPGPHPSAAASQPSTAPAVSTARVSVPSASACPRPRSITDRTALAGSSGSVGRTPSRSPGRPPQRTLTGPCGGSRLPTVLRSRSTTVQVGSTVIVPSAVARSTTRVPSVMPAARCSAIGTIRRPRCPMTAVATETATTSASKLVSMIGILDTERRSGEQIQICSPFRELAHTRLSPRIRCHIRGDKTDMTARQRAGRTQGRNRDDGQHDRHDGGADAGRARGGRCGPDGGGALPAGGERDRLPAQRGRAPAGAGGPPGPEVRGAPPAGRRRVPAQAPAGAGALVAGVRQPRCGGPQQTGRRQSEHLRRGPDPDPTRHHRRRRHQPERGQAPRHPGPAPQPPPALRTAPRRQDRPVHDRAHRGVRAGVPRPFHGHRDPAQDRPAERGGPPAPVGHPHRHRQHQGLHQGAPRAAAARAGAGEAAHRPVPPLRAGCPGRRGRGRGALPVLRLLGAPRFPGHGLRADGPGPPRGGSRGAVPELRGQRPGARCLHRGGPRDRGQPLLQLRQHLPRPHAVHPVRGAIRTGRHRTGLRLLPHLLLARLRTTRTPSPTSKRRTPMDTRTDLAPLPPLVPGTLLVAVGPGASGKSTFAARAGVAVLGLDALREEIGGDPGEQSVTPAAVELQNARLEEYLRAGTLVLLDSTNVETRVRAELVERARRHSRPAVALRFVPGLDICLERNRLRPANRRIPDDVLRWQHELAREATAEVLLGEGFTAVHQITPAPAAAR
ncbi:hypothetical protein CG736_34860 [Kitasatospora sp. CB02891]|nr:hypothetical protein CG736_34860 [Kitasatospora sp. CB02891]